MQVFFQARDPRARSLRDTAVVRVRFVLRRLGWLVPRAHVQLSDLNGPRGGVDKRCRVELAAGPAGTVVVTATAHDWRAAFEIALARAARAVARSWQRTRRQPQAARRTIVAEA